MNEIQDEHAGKGGSYVKDADGKRVLQERTDSYPLPATRYKLPATDHAPQQTEPVAVAAPKKNTSTKREGNK